MHNLELLKSLSSFFFHFIFPFDCLLVYFHNLINSVYWFYFCWNCHIILYNEMIEGKQNPIYYLKCVILTKVPSNWKEFISKFHIHFLCVWIILFLLLFEHRHRREKREREVFFQIEAIYLLCFATNNLKVPIEQYRNTHFYHLK